jgi:hypothetical protein
MRRAVGFDVLARPRCGHRMGLIALVEQAEVIRRLLHETDRLADPGVRDDLQEGRLLQLDGESQPQRPVQRPIAGRVDDIPKDHKRALRQWAAAPTSTRGRRARAPR